MIIRQAEKGEARQCAELMYCAGTEWFDLLYKRCGYHSLDFLQYAFRSGTGFHGYRFQTVAEVDGLVSGNINLVTRRECFRRERDEERLTLKFFGESEAQRIKHTDKALRLLNCLPPADGVFIDTLGVRPDCRGKGIGSRLIEYAATSARGQGLRALYLQVAVNNPRAEALYRRIGFEQLDQRPFLGRCPRPVPAMRLMRLGL